MTALAFGDCRGGRIGRRGQGPQAVDVVHAQVQQPDRPGLNGRASGEVARVGGQETDSWFDWRGTSSPGVRPSCEAPPG